jgi:hypothetical protein
MKQLNINEMRELIADMNRKLAKRASMEDLENMRIAVKSEVQIEIERIKNQLTYFK